MRKMTRLFEIYGKIARPWLTLVVYLWILELLVTFSARDPEPLFDRIADCSAILATLSFWICAGVLLPSLIALFDNRRTIFTLSAFALKVAMILVTAFYFVHWIFIWAALFGATNAVTYLLLGVGLLLAVWSGFRLKNRVQSTAAPVTLEHGWCYFGRPVLLAAILILVVKLSNNFWWESGARPSFAHPSARRPNVVLLTADALRAQNMSLYGYHRKTTPFLDRFASESNVYTQMHANSTSTRPSLTTILTGKDPFSHGRLTKFLPVYDSPENLVALLRDQGYTTAAISSNADATFYYLGLVKYLVHGEYPNFRRLTLSFLRDNGVYPTRSGTRMYDEFARWFFPLGYPERTLGYGAASDTIALATQTLTKLPEPFFLFVHLHEPHDPYETPPPFKDKYARVGNREAREKLSGFYYGRYQPDLQPFVDAERDHYDEAIEYLDAELEQFVNALRRSPKSQNTLLVLTTDHGESFERGFLNHGEDLYESSIHVPLVIKFPGQRKGERLFFPVQSIDIAPTIVETAGIAVPNWMDGVSLIKPEGLDRRENIAVNYKDPAQRKIYDQPTKAAIRWRQFKMIVSCDVGRAELYDLDQDSGERNDLFQSSPALVGELWEKLQRHLAKSAAKMPCLFHPNG
jgi:arylsulfatase A-like enzyme